MTEVRFEQRGPFGLVLAAPARLEPLNDLLVEGMYVVQTVLGRLLDLIAGVEEADQDPHRLYAGNVVVIDVNVEDRNVDFWSWGTERGVELEVDLFRAILEEWTRRTAETEPNSAQ
jgi:hypothetical protein